MNGGDVFFVKRIQSKCISGTTSGTTEERIYQSRSRINSKDKVRIAQYLAMMPAQENDKDLVKWRVNSWKNRVAPEGYAFPGDPRGWEQKKYKTANLSSLGKKILGLYKW